MDRWRCHFLESFLILSHSQVELMMGDSRHSVTNLQIQFDEYRERSRKDLLEAQRSSKDRLAELQRAQTNLKTQQEEVRKDGSRNVQDFSFHCCLADTVEVGRSLLLLSDRYFLSSKFSM